MAWVLVLAAMVALAAATTLKVRDQFRTAPGFAVGAVLAVTGLLGSDALRFLADQPLWSLVVAEVGTLGMVLVVRGLYRSWLEVLCEAWILAGGLTLLVILTTMLVRPAPGGALAGFDVTQLSLAVFACVAPTRLLDEALGQNHHARRLASLGLFLRIMVWCAQVACSWMSFAQGHALAVALLVTGYLIAPSTAVALARGEWRREYRTALVPSSRSPYAVMVVALALLAATLVLAPQSRQVLVLVLAGGAGAALLVRQIVTNQRLQEAADVADRQEKYFRALVQDVQDVVMICDDAGHLEYVSPAAVRVLPSGRDTDHSTLGQALGCDQAAVEAALREARAQGSSTFVVRHTGQVLETSVGARRSGFVLAVRDVTERDRLRERLHALAYEDGLTGLPNRRLLLERLDARLARGVGEGLALLFVDLDRFKQVNDSSGHQAGDELLQQVAARIVGVVGTDAMLARLGGDEFVVVVEGGERDAVLLARRVHAAIMAPFALGTRVHQVGASVGVALADGRADAATLLQRADLAMYAAKKQGMPWWVFTADLKHAADEQADADHVMARTWGRAAVRMHLQPIVRTADLRVHSVEALLRWRMPDGQVLGPVRPLDYALRTGQMGMLTSWTLDSALDTLSRVGTTVPVAINAPPSLLHLPDLADRARRVVERHGLSPADLHLELTEDALVDEAAHHADVLGEIRAAGFAVAIDDFGTGYSSLSYLLRLPIDAIKLDRAFVRELPTSSAARSLVTSLVGFARDLEVGLVAEGVETQEEASWVHELGVPLAQGYWYARPRDADLLERLDDLAAWGDDRGGGATPRTAVAVAPEAFALEGGEC